MTKFIGGIVKYCGFVLAWLADLFKYGFGLGEDLLKLNSDKWDEVAGYVGLPVIVVVILAFVGLRWERSRSHSLEQQSSPIDTQLNNVTSFSKSSARCPTPLELGVQAKASARKRLVLLSLITLIGLHFRWDLAVVFSTEVFTVYVCIINFFCWGSLLIPYLENKSTPLGVRKSIIKGPTLNPSFKVGLVVIVAIGYFVYVSIHDLTSSRIPDGETLTRTDGNELIVEIKHKEVDSNDQQPLFDEDTKAVRTDADKSYGL